MHSRRTFVESLEPRQLFNAGDVVGSYSIPSMSNFTARDVALQADGKVVVVGSIFTGTHKGELVVARFRPGGTLDPDFSGGIVFLTFGDRFTRGTVFGQNVVIEPSTGKIVVTGEGASPSLSKMVIARLTTEGALDPSFSGDGWDVPFTPDYVSTFPHDLAIDANGKLVVAGDVELSAFVGGGNDMLVVRYNANGTLDSTFSGDGFVNADFGETESASALAVDTAAGKIVVAGKKYGSNANASDFAVLRLNPNGTSDNTFSGDGRVATPFISEYASNLASAVVVQPGGKVVISGSVGTINSADTNVGLIRFNDNGTRDASFGVSNGDIEIDLGAGAATDDTAQSLIVGLSGNLLVGGDAAGVSTVACLTPDGRLDPVFGGDGRVSLPATGASAYGMDRAPDGTFVLAGGGAMAWTRVDDREAATVSIGSLDAFGAESPQDPATILVTRAAPTPAPLRVYLAVGGSATPPFPGVQGSDYIVTNATFDAALNRAYVDIPANAVAAVVTVYPFNDALDEGDELAIFNVSDGGAYDYRTDASRVTLGIADDDHGGVATPTTAPDMNAASDRGVSTSDDVTNLTTPRFSGDAGATFAGRYVRVYADGVLYGGPTAAGSDGRWTVNAGIAGLADGVHHLQWTLALTPTSLESGLSPPLAVVIDTVKPQLLGSGFAFETGHQIRFTFNENVAGASSLRLATVNTTTGQMMPTTAFAGGADGPVATWTCLGGLAGPGGLLPDGNYTATLSAFTVSDTAGNLYDPAAINRFFVLSGDANRDRTVGPDDFNRLATNFGKTGQTFSTGDFDYDRTDGPGDFNVLATRFGTTLPPPAGTVRSGVGTGSRDLSSTQPLGASDPPATRRPVARPAVPDPPRAGRHRTQPPTPRGGIAVNSRQPREV